MDVVALGLAKADAAKRYRRNPNTLCIIGDSITARGRVSTGTQQATNDLRGYWTHALVRLSHRFKLLNVAGVNGDTLDGVAARLATDVLAYNPGWCIFEAGVNNVNNSTDSSQNLTVAQFQTKYTAIFGQLLAAGIRVVVMAIGPHNGSSTAQNLVMNQVNEWLRDYCTTTPGLVYVGWPSRIIAGDGTNNWNATYSPDGLHPYALGAARMGKMIADILDPLTPKIDRLGASSGDTDNLLTNPWFNGTVGGVGPGTGWTLTAGTGTLRARTDQGAGQMMELVTTSALSTQLYQTIDTGWAVGDQFVATCEFSAPTAWTSATSFTLQVVAYDGSFTQLGMVGDMDNGSGDTYPLENQLASGVMRTPRLTVPTGTVHIRLIGRFNGQGLVNWMRMSLRKATS